MSRAISTTVLLLGLLGVARADEPAPIWKAELKTQDQPIAPVDAVGFSRDGTMIFARVPLTADVLAGRRSMVVWQLDSKKERGRFATFDARLSFVGPPMAMNGPADWLAVDGTATVRLSFDAEKPVKADLGRGMIHWSIREGEYLSAMEVESGGALTWQRAQAVADGRPPLPTVSARIKEHPDGWPITALAIDPNGRLMATAFYSRDGREVTLTLDSIERTDSVTLNRRGEANAGPTGRMSCASFSPNGKRLATGGDDGLLRLWNTDNAWDRGWTPKSTLRVTKMSVSAVAFHPSGKWLAYGTTNGNKTKASIGFIDVATGKLARQFEVATGIWSLAFSPDGRSLLTGNHLGAVALWDANAILDEPKK